jgi:hypothetical protein
MVEIAPRGAGLLITAHRAADMDSGRLTVLGAPGLRGPRALEELALLLVCTGELTPAGLRRLPASTSPR